MLHGLAYPPGGVSGQLGFVVEVEAVDGFEQSTEPFLNEICVRDPPIAKPLGDVSDQPEIGQCEFASEFAITFQGRTKLGAFQTWKEFTVGEELGETKSSLGGFDVRIFDGFERIGEFCTTFGEIF